MDGIKQPRRRPRPQQQPQPHSGIGGGRLGVRPVHSAAPTKPVGDLRYHSAVRSASSSAADRRALPPSHTASTTPRPPVSVTSPAHQPAQKQPKQSAGKPKRALRLSTPQKIGIGVILLFLLVAAWFVGCMLLFGMKKTAYENGQGGKYEMDFYRRSHNAKAIDGSSLKTLVSNVSRQSKEPLTVSITVLPNKPDDGAIFCYANGDKKFSVRNKYTNKDIFICPSGHNDNFSMYGAIFESNDKWHRLTAQQNVLTQNENGTDPNEIIKKRTGVNPYRADIEAIVKSVKATE